MKTIFIVVLVGITFLSSCTPKKQNGETIKDKFYYLVFSSKSDKIDTFYVDTARFNLENLHKLDSIDKSFSGRRIKIYKITNLPEAPMDGEFMGFWEKNVGIFYNKGLSWYSFSILKSNNDSINAYINMLLGAVAYLPNMTKVPEEKSTLTKEQINELLK